MLETKLTNTLDGGYSQGGIMAYGSDNDYVKLNAISDDGQGRVNRLELRSEVGGVVSADAADPQITAAQAAGPIWLRLTKAGNTYTGRVQDHRGRPVDAFSGPVTNAMVAPRFGLYTQRRAAVRRHRRRSSTSRSTATRRAARRPSPRTPRR